MTNTTLTFGKYKNQTIEQVYSTDKPYILWLAENAYQDTLKQTVKSFLDGKKQEDKIVMKDGKYVINFGKFYGKTLMEAYKDKPRYMNWILRTFEDDQLVQTIVTDFLNHIKVVNKRVKSITKVRNERIEREKFEAANTLATDINNLDKDRFYVSSKIFKINSVDVCDKTARVSMNITEYSYSVMDNGYTVGSTKNTTVTSIPAEFIPSEYEVVFLNGSKVYNTDGEEVEIEVKTRYNVRVMSDVYDDVVEHWYKGVEISSSCHLGTSVRESISPTSKVITVKVNNVENAVRKYKVSILIEKLT